MGRAPLAKGAGGLSAPLLACGQFTPRGYWENEEDATAGLWVCKEATGC
jgi:hypothetical protein